MAEEPEKLAEGTLISHLLELRDRIIKALIGVALCFLPCMMYSNDIFSYVSQPLQEKLPAGTHLIATSVMSPFTTPFKLSFFIAAFLAMPWILYQLWAFVAPGLYRQEKRFAVPLLVSAILLFYVGVSFAYFFVFPVMFSFFASTTPKGVSMMTDINQYLDFVLVMFFAFGGAFEVPVAVVLLVITGIVKLEKLKENRRYVFLGCFIVAALLTPPDAVSQSIMALPMYLLFEGGLLMARVLLRMKQSESEHKELQT
jgi:sec-independent protein translocase protein TatC